MPARRTDAGAVRARPVTVSRDSTIAATALTMGVAAAAEDKPSVETLFKLPKYGAMVLSPDGEHIAALAPVVLRLAAEAITGNDSPPRVLVGGLGSDTMAGGAGNDTYYVNAAGDVVQDTVAGTPAAAATLPSTRSSWSASPLAGRDEECQTVPDRACWTTGSS